MEKLSDILEVPRRKPDPAKQWHLRQWYISHYHHERFFVIELIDREELDILQKMETKKGCWLLPHEIRTKINELRIETKKSTFNWPGFNEAEQKDYGIGTQSIEVLKEKIKNFINNCNFNEDECDEYNWHIIDNVLFDNKTFINYRTIRVEPEKTSKLL